VQSGLVTENILGKVRRGGTPRPYDDIDICRSLVIVLLNNICRSLVIVQLDNIAGNWKLHVSIKAENISRCYDIISVGHARMQRIK
jgi:hypothetical protein